MRLRSGRKADSEAHRRAGRLGGSWSSPNWLKYTDYSAEEKEALLDFCDDLDLKCSCDEARLPNCVNGPDCRKCHCDLCLGITDPFEPCVCDEYFGDHRVPVADIFRAANLI